MNTPHQQRKAVTKQYRGYEFSFELYQPQPTSFSGVGYASIVTPKPETRYSPLYRAVETVTGMSRAELKSGQRHRTLAYARFIFMYLAHAVLFQTNVTIGRELNRDHTTIMHGRHRVQDLRIIDKNFARQYEAVEALL